MLKSLNVSMMKCYPWWQKKLFMMSQMEHFVRLAVTDFMIFWVTDYGFYSSWLTEATDWYGWIVTNSELSLVSQLSRAAISWDRLPRWEVISGSMSLKMVKIF